MSVSRSVEFFDRQFAQQAGGPSPGLNPFEQAALPHLRGSVLDYGCGMGELSLAAARAGCDVLALDASEVAVNHLRRQARAERLSIRADVADLRSHRIQGEYDSVVSIGLLMFFDCASAARVLANLQDRVRPGGVAIVNVLVEGTTYLDMFEPSGHCLFGRTELEARFAGWRIVDSRIDEFAAPGNRVKVFSTVVAAKP